MASEWFYFKGDQRFGPVGSKQLKELASTGDLLPIDSIWKEGMADPLPAAKLKGLFEEADKPIPLPDVPPSRSVATPPSLPKSSPEVGHNEVKAKGIPALLWQWCKLYLRFLWSVVTATWYAAKIIVGDMKARLESNRLKQNLVKEQTALGEELYAGGLGDAGLLEQIADKDKAIRKAEASGPAHIKPD